MRFSDLLVAALSAILVSGCATPRPPAPAPAAASVAAAARLAQPTSAAVERPGARDAAAQRPDSRLHSRAAPGKPGRGSTQQPPQEWPQEPGLDPEALEAIDRAILDAIERRVTPGAALAIGRRDGVVHMRGYGTLTYAPGSPSVTDSTLYDLASLTKVVGTTTGIMLLVQRGAVELDAPLSRYLPDWPRGGWRDEVTVRRLLTHSSGLPAFIRFWHPDAGALRGSDEIVAAIMATPQSYPPGTRTVYSDLGAILLGEVVEAVSGQPLDAFLDDEVWTPLGMDDTGFRPRPDLGLRDPSAPLGRELDGPLPPLDRIAPTEVDEVFRDTLVHGVVHDENAYAMGGVAGHAGLFSTVRDLARFARMMLRGGELGAVRVLRPEAIERFTGAQPASDRALGWDRPPGSGNMAEPLSERAFGHTGFTGTSVWVDPELDLFVVLLTNRVHPTREGSGTGDLRRIVHRLAAAAATEESEPGEGRQE